jgi:tRNA(fMet)-specific endonuclease VapC
MAGYLLDTNHLSEAIRPVSRVRDRIEQARRSGLRVGTCVPALCELQAAIQPLTRRDRYEQALRRLLGRVRVWPMDQTVPRVYGQVFTELRHRGRVLSQVDMMLAALARQMDLTVVTADRDFDALPDIRKDDWLA